MQPSGFNRADQPRQLHGPYPPADRLSAVAVQRKTAGSVQSDSMELTCVACEASQRGVGITGHHFRGACSKPVQRLTVGLKRLRHTRPLAPLTHRQHLAAAHLGNNGEKIISSHGKHWKNEPFCYRLQNLNDLYCM